MSAGQVLLPHACSPGGDQGAEGYSLSLVGGLWDRALGAGDRGPALLPGHSCPASGPPSGEPPLGPCAHTPFTAASPLLST